MGKCPVTLCGHRPMELRTNAKDVCSSTTHFLHDGTPVVLINKGPFRDQTSSLIVWGREFLSQLRAALGDTRLRGDSGHVLLAEKDLGSTGRVLQERSDLSTRLGPRVSVRLMSCPVGPQSPAWWEQAWAVHGRDTVPHSHWGFSVLSWASGASSDASATTPPRTGLSQF